MKTPVGFAFHDKPPLPTTLLVSLQHLFAVTGGIITAPLIIALGMGLSIEDTSYLVSSSLVISGLATFIQVSRFGIVGSGLLSIQGTSFTFIGPLIFSYATLVDGHTPSETMAIIFGCCAACAGCMLVLSRFVVYLKKYISTNVSGTTVMLIGLSLVWTTLQNLTREYQQVAVIDSDSAWLVPALALIVFGITLILSVSHKPLLKITSITVALVFGLCLAWGLNLVDLSQLKQLDGLFYPQIGYFSLDFDLGIFFLLLPIFLISATETVGDLTATAKLSGLSLADDAYWQRIRGGIAGDAINSLMAAIFSTFPNTSFSQNNGVIRLTGICNPRVGIFTALALCVMGVFPIVGGVFIVMPASVLYGATLLMFIMVFLSGIAIVNSGEVEVQHWSLVITSAVLGILISIAAGTMSWIPDWLRIFLQFPVSTSAMIALLLEVLRLKAMPMIAVSEH